MLTLGSPAAKRCRLSLNKNKKFSSESSPAIEKEDMCITQENKNDLVCHPDAESMNISDECLVQDENASPNCSSLDLKAAVSSVLPETIDHPVPKTSALGLPNCGNTCFINSILQVLRYTPDFLDSIHLLVSARSQFLKIANEAPTNEDVGEITFFTRLHALYISMKRQEILLLKNVDKDFGKVLLKPVNAFLLSLREISSLFEEGEQHDAHELLLTIISTFSSTCEKVKNLNDANKISQTFLGLEITKLTVEDISCSVAQNVRKKMIKKKRGRKKQPKPTFKDYITIDNLDLGFEGTIRNIVKCLECEKGLEKEEVFASLEISVSADLFTDGIVDLQRCLAQTNTLSGDNKYFCEECCHLNEARLSSKVITSPAILLLHFNWMKKTMEVTDIEKANLKVMIPLSLQTADNDEIFSCIADQNYRLYAIVLHIGQSTDCGHYVTLIKDGSQKAVTKCPRTNILQTNIPSTISCCATEEILNLKANSSANKWLLFDDEAVSPICIDETAETFPYFDYVGATASPCMIFYHQT